MAQEYPLAKKPHLSRATLRPICLAVVALACLPLSPASALNYGPNLMPAGNFEHVTPTYVPWAGVDDKGNIHGIDGKQIAIDENGSIIRASNFGPSIAVGDLNGDGKADLVLADTYGFFWFFPNSGTVRKPVFTQGEVIPIWLGDERTASNVEGVENIVPRIQFVDFEHNKQLDILAGTYAGKLYRLRNTGSPMQPRFSPTKNRDSLLINTHKGGVLWCNYLAPFLTDAFGSPNVLDLIMGEGTYSANSIYLLRNTSSNATPAFDEDHLQKIILGTGLEQLTPAVVDWDNDGKPDIICGDRTGYLNLYLNTSTDPDHPTFAPGVHVKIAGVEKLGNSITVSIGDLSGNHLPNLLIGKDDGTILYAENTGKLGAPQFLIPATPLKGVLPPDCHYVAPADWRIHGAYGAPYELIACVNPQLEPGFTFPQGETSKYAMKFFVWPGKNLYFPERYYPPFEDEWREHFVQCAQHVTLKLNKRYRVHFWVKAGRNISNLRYRLFADFVPRVGFHGDNITRPVSAGSSWTKFSDEINVLNPHDPTVTTWSYGFEFRFAGQSTFYIDDIQIQEEL